MSSSDNSDRVCQCFGLGVKLSRRDSEQRLVLLADLATKCRSSVERSGHDREIELIPQAEALGRLQSELVQLGRGLTWIGVGPERIDEHLARVALDGMSKNRRAIVKYFVGQGRNLVPTSRDIANQLRLPTPAHAPSMEDLAAHGVVEKFGFERRPQLARQRVAEGEVGVNCFRGIS